MDLNLKGKTAIVTGGNTGIGSGICEVLAGEGMNIIVTYIVGEPEAIAFAKKLSEQFGTKCTAVYCDITNTDHIAGLMCGGNTSGLSGFAAAVYGAYICGKAGESAAEDRGVISMTPADTLANIPLITRDMMKK